MPVDLNNHHRDTLLRIFQHPTSHNIEWRAVASLLEVVGTIEEHRDGRFRVQIGSDLELLFLLQPHLKYTPNQQLFNLGSLFEGGGAPPRGSKPEAKGTED